MFLHERDARTIHAAAQTVPDPATGQIVAPHKA